MPIMNNASSQRLNPNFITNNNNFEQFTIPQMQQNMSYFYPNNNNSYLISGNIQRQSNNSQTCLTLVNTSNRNNNDGSYLSSSESFKLIEKIQPKKSRTKYTKEQVYFILFYFYYYLNDIFVFFGFKIN